MVEWANQRILNLVRKEDGMSRKHHKSEQVINLLREAEVGLSQGKKVGELCRSLGISEQSYYRWLTDGSCTGLRPSWANHVWTYDFAHDRTHDGRRIRMLTVIDEFTRTCLAIVVARNLNSDDVLRCLTELFVRHGPPDHIRSDNGSEFTAAAVRAWLSRIGVKTLRIEPGRPGENGYDQNFNGKLRDELLNSDILYALKEAQVLIERWRQDCNTIRPHSSLGYRPPARRRSCTILQPRLTLGSSQPSRAQTNARFSHKRWTTDRCQISDSSLASRFASAVRL